MLDADDYWLENHLKDCLARLQESDVDGLYGSLFLRRILSENVHDLPVFQAREIMEDESMIDYLLTTGFGAQTSTLFTKAHHTKDILWNPEVYMQYNLKMYLRAEREEVVKFAAYFRKEATRYWECNVRTYCSKKPLSENDAMKKVVRRFSLQETEGIVLDGFIAPYPAFFAFCSCLLEKYRFDERIGHISGWDFRKQDRKTMTHDSYFFSKLIHTNGGWASWRRVWKDMNVQMKTFSSFKRHNIIDDIPTHKPSKLLWLYLNYLDGRWNARCEYINLINNRLSVVMNTRQIPLNKYELTEIRHPVFMVNPINEELEAQELKYRIPAVTCGFGRSPDDE